MILPRKSWAPAVTERLSSLYHREKTQYVVKINSSLKKNPQEWLFVATALTNQATECKGPPNKHFPTTILQILYFRS